MKYSNQIEFLLKALYGHSAKEASVKELYNATSKIVMSEAMPKWNNTQSKENKRCGYLSAEFLIGRLVYSNMLNLDILDNMKKALKELGRDINEFEEVEDDALGNGGLGRLAACFLDSAATHDVLLDGYGLRYKYGLFKQSFVNGYQHEEADDWQKWGDPFSIRREEDSVRVHFADFDVMAVPYDYPVIGYKSETINTLRLWQAENSNDFNFKAFDDMKGESNAIEDYRANEITYVLYPNDNTIQGKYLRLRQEYFMVSATLQDFIRKYKASGFKWSDMKEHQIWQLNDTHPTLAIPEFIRLLNIEGLSYTQALEIARGCFNFTNHTIMGEALEKWPVSMLRDLIPDVLNVIEYLQTVISLELNNTDLYIIHDNIVHMANLAIFVSSHVNGVAKIHTEILKNDTFKEWDKVYPGKILNVTNGITPRRWVALNNPLLSKLISSKIGDEWIKDLRKLSDLNAFAYHDSFVNSFIKIKEENKKTLSKYILEHDNVSIDSSFLFDIQIKRLHEYKRQLLNALSILYIYNELKSGNLPDFKPQAFIFGAKSAPGYYIAKAIIKFINEIANLVNNDKDVSSKLKVVFIENYNVSYAERLVCAADISEQISMAGMEASGTGNMKFMANGTPTLGTLDGANVEICDMAGIENNYIFGLTVDEINDLKPNYDPNIYLENNSKLKAIVETLINGTFDDSEGYLRALYDSLTIGDRKDYYLVFADFDSYINAKLRVNKEYGTKEYYKKCIANMVNSSNFSSDRSILDYDKNIWNL